MIKLLAAAFILAFSVFILKNFGWRGAPVMAAVCAAILLAEAGDELLYVFGSIKKISGEADLADSIAVALKVLGLGYLFGISADICRELGESGIAKSVEVVGRVEIIAVVIPYFEEIIRVGLGLIR